MPGKLITDPSLLPAGPVVKTLYEELRAYVTPAGPAGEVVTSITTTWDDAGRVIQVIEKRGISETVTNNRYEAGRIVSQESTSPNSSQPNLKSWNYWTYDKSGKLIEYRRGRGDELQNHDTNFKRDAQGRLVSYEYRQGPKDVLFSRTVLRYSAGGETIDFTDYDETGSLFQSMTERLDDQGRAVEATTRNRDWRTKQMKTPIKAIFRYDEKGRLIEQETDAPPFEKAGAEHQLPPGKISIAYDDAKHTKTTSYSSDEGLLAVTVTFNAKGETIGYAGGTKRSAFESVIHCTDDNHGNWVTCEQTVKSAGRERVEKMWRRTITYR